LSLRVLLADDHDVLRKGLRAIFEAAPDVTIVGEASDGLEALKLVRELAPDVVIMDLSMPTLNGIEATAAIRDEALDTQVVILSMHATSEHVYRAFEAGATGYLVKESAVLEVVEAARAAAGGKRFLSRKLRAFAVDDYERRRRGDEPKRPLD